MGIPSRLERRRTRMPFPQSLFQDSLVSLAQLERGGKSARIPQSGPERGPVTIAADETKLPMSAGGGGQFE